MKLQTSQRWATEVTQRSKAPAALSEAQRSILSTRVGWLITPAPGLDTMLWPLKASTHTSTHSNTHTTNYTGIIIKTFFFNDSASHIQSLDGLRCHPRRPWPVLLLLFGFFLRGKETLSGLYICGQPSTKHRTFGKASRKECPNSEYKVSHAFGLFVSLHAKPV